MEVAKRQREEKARKKMTKENSRTGVRISGETNSLPDKPNLHKGRRKKQKQEPKFSLWLIFFSHLFQGYIFLCLPNKTEL